MAACIIAVVCLFSSPTGGINIKESPEVSFSKHCINYFTFSAFPFQHVISVIIFFFCFR